MPTTISHGFENGCVCVCVGGRILAFAVWPLRDKVKGGGPSDSIKMDFGLLGCHFEVFRQRFLENGSRDEKRI